MRSGGHEPRTSRTDDTTGHDQSRRLSSSAGQFSIAWKPTLERATTGTFSRNRLPSGVTSSKIGVSRSGRSGGALEDGQAAKASSFEHELADRRPARGSAADAPPRP